MCAKWLSKQFPTDFKDILGVCFDLFLKAHQAFEGLSRQDFFFDLFTGDEIWPHSTFHTFPQCIRSLRDSGNHKEDIVYLLILWNEAELWASRDKNKSTKISERSLRRSELTKICKLSKFPMTMCECVHLRWQIRQPTSCDDLGSFIDHASQIKCLQIITCLI